VTSVLLAVVYAAGRDDGQVVTVEEFQNLLSDEEASSQQQDGQ
jgi:hypothetical protein